MKRRGRDDGVGVAEGFDLPLRVGPAEHQHIYPRGDQARALEPDEHLAERRRRAVRNGP